MAKDEQGIIGRFTSSVNKRQQQLDAAANSGRRPAAPAQAAPAQAAPAPKLNAMELRIKKRRDKRAAAKAKEDAAFRQSLRTGAAN